MEGRVLLASSLAAPEDEAIAERLMQSFDVMMRYREGTPDPADVLLTGIWEVTEQQFQGEFYRLMAERAVPALAGYMRNATRKPITHGLGPRRQMFDAMAAGGAGLAANVLIFRDSHGLAR